MRSFIILSFYHFINSSFRPQGRKEKDEEGRIDQGPGISERVIALIIETFGLKYDVVWGSRGSVLT